MTCTRRKRFPYFRSYATLV